MPADKDNSVLIIGAGPTVIGQSGECDQGAVEACLALKAEGYRVVAVNSNPDAIMADTDIADRSYIESLRVDTLAEIIAGEKPSSVLTGFGGRAGLDLAVQLHHSGILAKFHVTLWGTAADSLSSLLERDALKALLAPININTLTLYPVTKEQDAQIKAQELGYPVVLRCDDPNLIPDGLLVYNQEELGEKTAPITGEQTCSLTIEASLWNHRQVELEILRDNVGQVTLAGTVEYLDAAGIHPGDALSVCPAQTISQSLKDKLFNSCKAIADHLNIIGGATIRFAYTQAEDTVLVLAVHPRYTRTSALVARVTGMPLASMAALIASGKTLSQLEPDISQGKNKANESSIVGVKWPVWDFTSLDEVEDRLGPRMQSVGQAIGIGADFIEAIQKAARSASPGSTGFSGVFVDKKASREELMYDIATPGSRRPFIIVEALRKKAGVAEISEKSNIHAWFIGQFKKLADSAATGAKVSDTIRYLECSGSWSRNAQSPDGRKVLILGSGTHRIGQGSENDYGVFHAAGALKTLGYTPLIINDNLTSITTGSAIVGRCYCNPLDLGSIQTIIENEKPVGVIAQFAGPFNFPLICALEQHGVTILGTPLQTLKLLQNRALFWGRMRELGIPQPAAALAGSMEEALVKAEEIGFPLLVQAAHGGMAELIMDKAMLENYLTVSGIKTGDPLFIEQFLEYAIEAQAEAVCDGNAAMVTAVLEHIELAGVNATDSACVLPPYSIAPRHVETVTAYAEKIAAALGVKGLLNIRFALYRDSVFVLEARCDICRNIGMVSKVTHIPVASLATELIMDEGVKKMKNKIPPLPYYCVCAAVFPFNVFTDLDPLLGQKMRATGEVLSFGDSYGMAYFKAQQATGCALPVAGGVLITVTDEDKASILEPARLFQEMGFNLLATRGTQISLAENGITAQPVTKLGFGRPNLVDEIKNGNVQMVINTPSDGQSHKDDSYIRKAAIRYRIANITTPASALAAAKGIAAGRKSTIAVNALQDYQKMLPYLH